MQEQDNKISAEFGTSAGNEQENDKKRLRLLGVFPQEAKVSYVGNGNYFKPGQIGTVVAVVIMNKDSQKSDTIRVRFDGDGTVHSMKWEDIEVWAPPISAPKITEPQ